MSSDGITPTVANVVWHRATVTRARREGQNGHRGAVIWFPEAESEKHCQGSGARS